MTNIYPVGLGGLDPTYPFDDEEMLIRRKVTGVVRGKFGPHTDEDALETVVTRLTNMVAEGANDLDRRFALKMYTDEAEVNKND